ncbi:hypothetical protein FD724_06520 [Nostoc sp. C057]|uniref:hypothetical protein n=1 Tax=Nostoc sp. C057 TaxID=2576903 RepID=UPI0015C31D76|nr:hypothetical protein [Nostoc sp. C057]QLE47794.1 hypothetical protein FD724_06520 [Nostoc sp. C057]
MSLLEVFLVGTHQKTPAQVYNYLRSNCLDDDDHIFVTEADLSTAIGWLPLEICDWINARTPIYR